MNGCRILNRLYHILSKLLILMPFNRIKKILETKSSESIKTGKYNEITDIFIMDREKIAKEIEILEKDKESLSKIIEHSQNSSIRDCLSFVILNSFNKIVYAYDKIGKILKKRF
ncbi:MAG: hypothetical protein LE180_03320 [Endomicrobium sp.]|uniref:hypothetical protein n=1 Tax=Candidatus Endomicrobiellum pyrsonymphae TaxID=1408203 RepID=UPI00358A99EB|nr:hypothetical protein [Endomicrobium sp.]